MNHETSDLFSYRGDDLGDEGYSVYKHLRDSELCEGDRAYINELWRQFQSLGLADPSFVERFRAECPARIWEMRLACTLTNWGIKLIPSKDPGAGMDFGIDLNEGGRALWIEATVPLPGDEKSEDRVSVPQCQAIFGNELDRTTALRYLNSINNKRRQFSRALTSGLVAPDDGVIIAISGSYLPERERSGSFPLIVKALFGLGEPTFVTEIGSGRVRRGPSERRPSFRKSSGKDVSARLFCSTEADEITGVLFDQPHVKNRPEVYGRPAGDDFVLVHNPFARLPLIEGQFRCGREYHNVINCIDHRNSFGGNAQAEEQHEE
ncbi:hypothetical protein [Myxococcus llanfairpwllgwyngyllgogerychwyrndrobwllllantysiliogogogochensis]|uniref:hypothetical protein n=1 Tax=Myxococcus llanfairpwllgwyngyllgogerychwyrndrobwllllantysiliogogogochensis TaxID=2590453 RepID=UPI001C66DDDA|nr:hypothetical protein [Myxococcus llanfairpwllgwyngyllgogerychwyrndrobwllllantysiliogogogochensis]